MKTSWLSIAFALALLPSCDGEEPPEFTGVPCEDSSECEDGLFCNGTSICLGGECVNPPPPSCDDGIECTIDSCNEVVDRCESRSPDADDDGVSDVSCTDLNGIPLGTDCDDNNPNVFPGNAEVCDEDNLDEDCDPNTFGNSDEDGDGLVSNECCNEAADGELLCGTDCDDDFVAIVPGAQSCVDGSPQQVLVCQADGNWEQSLCPFQGSCNLQPNGTGICLP